MSELEKEILLLHPLPEGASVIPYTTMQVLLFPSTKEIISHAYKFNINCFIHHMLLTEIFNSLTAEFSVALCILNRGSGQQESKG